MDNQCKLEKTAYSNIELSAHRYAIDSATCTHVINWFTDCLHILFKCRVNSIYSCYYPNNIFWWFYPIKGFNSTNTAKEENDRSSNDYSIFWIIIKLKTTDMYRNNPWKTSLDNTRWNMVAGENEILCTLMCDSWYILS